MKMCYAAASSTARSCLRYASTLLELPVRQMLSWATLANRFSYDSMPSTLMSDGKSGKE